MNWKQRHKETGRNAGMVEKGGSGLLYDLQTSVHPGALRFEGNLKSKDVSIFIGTFFPHIAPFPTPFSISRLKHSRDSRCRYFLPPLWELLKKCPNFPHSCNRNISELSINTKELFLSTDASSTVRITLSREVLKEVQIG